MILQYFMTTIKSIFYFFLQCFIITFFLVLMLPMSSFAGKPFYDLAINFAHEDNIGRSEKSDDIFSDNIVSYFGSANYLHQLNNNSGILFGSSAQWEDYSKTDKLDNFSFDVGVTYKYKPDLHYTSPWYSLGFKASRASYNKSELRDNYAFAVDVMAGKRITDRIMLKAGIAYKDQTATTDQSGLLGGKLYDIEYSKVFLGADYFYKQFIFYGQYTFQDGDVVSSSGKPTWNSKIGLAAKEIQRDDALSDDDWNGVYGYRLNAHTHIIDLGVNYALNRESALDFTIQLVEVRGDGDNNYHNYGANLGYFYRFK
jgi:hypothetical protein